MTTLELLQLENEHKEDNFYEKGEDKQVMSNEYTIHEDDDFESGDGIKIYIKDGYIIFEAAAECGYSGFEWEFDIESLKNHIAKYEQRLTT